MFRLDRQAVENHGQINTPTPMRYRLRMLLIVLALGPPALAVLWWLLPNLSPGQTALVMWVSLTTSGFIGWGLLIRAI